MKLIDRWKESARVIRHDACALYLALRDERTPWYAKAAAWCVVVYALSPIDLIPDFIPILGYLDDLLIVPLGIALVRRLIPEVVLAESRIRAAELANKPISRLGAALIIGLWIAAIVAFAYLLAPSFLGKVAKQT